MNLRSFVLALFSAVLWMGSAYATQNTECVSESGAIQISFLQGSLGSVVGNVRVVVDGQETIYAHDRIGGVWILDSALNLSLVDEDYLYHAVVLETQDLEGSVTLRSDLESQVRSEKVSCVQ